MKASLRALFARAALPILMGIFGVTETAWAQNQEKPAGSVKVQTNSGPQKPVWNSGWVTTNDPVALLALKREPALAEAARAEAAKTIPANEKTVRATPDEIAKRNAEIAALEKQIQEKQKRVALLMRLFVNDERPFLNDPGNAEGDATAAERRKYEQDELLYESAEIGRLRGRVEELKAAGKP